MTKKRKVRLLADGSIWHRALYCIIGFGVFAAWSVYVPLDEGFSAQGAIVVQDEKKVVQHFEGGIVETIAVREGDVVQEGQVLMVLSQTATGAARDQRLNALAMLEASVARLTALRAGLDAPDFTSVLAIGLDEDLVASVIEEQSNLFQEQRRAHAAELAILEAREQGALATASSRAQQAEASRRALDSVNEQLVSGREMLERRMVRLDQVQALEQSSARIESELAGFLNQKIEAEALAQDLRGQIEQANIKYSQDVAASLVDVRAKLNDEREALAASEDVVTRSTITAPQSGQVINLAFNTPGGVVRAGETIMEIVPEDGRMVASVRVRPNDRASVFSGQAAKLQLVAYRSWRVPKLDGVVELVSADLKTDPHNGATYYEARISIPENQLERVDGEVQIIPGMPVQVFMFSGASRTLSSYLMEPVAESFFKGAHTQ